MRATERGETGRRRILPTGSLMAFGVGGSATAIALLMLVAPSGLGASALSTHLSAPFKGAAHAYSSSGSSGCSREALAVAPFAQTKTGNEGWSGWASAKTCTSYFPGTGADSAAYIDAGWTFGIPFTVATNGPHSLFADGNFSINMTVKITTSGHCPTKTVPYSWGKLTTGYCNAYAEANYNGADYIQDQTNGSIFVGDLRFSPGNAVENTQSIYWGCYTPSYGSGCFSYNSSFVTPKTTELSPTGLFYGYTWDNGTLSSGHHYVFYYTEYHDVTTDVTGWTSATAYASENEATGGNGGQLTSVQVF
jgi:hypothetical protein